MGGILVLKLTISILVCLGLSASAQAQDTARFNLFGGYSFASVDTNGLSSRQSANGWEASISGNFSRWFAAEGDFSGYYKTFPVNNLDATDIGLGILNGKVDVRDFAFMGGPRVNFGPVFAHALIGFDRLTANASGTSDILGPLAASASQNSFASAFGGGIQQNVTSHLALRASADYVLTRHNIFRVINPSAPAFTQNNFRVSAGVVFTFGLPSLHRSARARPEPRLSSTPARSTPRNRSFSQPTSGTSEAPLLGVFGYATEYGFEVTSLRSDSPAATAGIEPGDTVVEIDESQVHSSADIESAIAANRTGTITIGYLIVRGQWLVKKDIKIR